MPGENVRADPAVVGRVQLVEDNEEEVKTTQQGVGEAYVILRPPALVVLPVDGVGGR